MCVMELASVLAGGRFTDHPESVSLVIAALLRDYNDYSEQDRRQDLVPYAARVVGTRAGRAGERELGRRCMRWLAAGSARRRWWLPASAAGYGRRAAREVARGRRTHADLLGLVDELIALRPHGCPDVPPPVPEAVAAPSGE